MHVRWKWLLAFVPLLVGISLAAYWNSQPGSQTIYLFTVDRLAIAQVTGAVLSTACLIGLGIQEWMQQRLRETERNADIRAGQERRRFIQRLDHELKNPITAMRAGMANLLGAPSVEDREAALASVEIQIMRLSRLSADLRKLTEMEGQPLEQIQVDLAGLLEEVVEVAREKPEARSRTISLTLPQAPWPLPTISGDWDLIYLAVYNLLDNALKYTNPGDTIELRALEADDQVVVEVADTGPGIPEDEAPHVWDELYRGNGARSLPGSGVGLALVRAIIERHGGFVSLRSRAGQGTVISMNIPQKKETKN